MRRSALAALIVAGLACAIVATSVPSIADTGPAREARVQARLDAIADNPTALRAFLTQLPKGGDLHQHLSGTVYAESLLRWAAEDGLCITRVTFGRPSPSPGPIASATA